MLPTFRTYSVGGDGDKTADVESRGVDGRRHSPMEACVIGSCDDVDSWNVLVHRGENQLYRITIKDVH
jgi:hypothetical protein